MLWWFTAVTNFEKLILYLKNLISLPGSSFWTDFLDVWTISYATLAWWVVCSLSWKGSILYFNVIEKFSSLQSKIVILTKITRMRKRFRFGKFAKTTAVQLTNNYKDWSKWLNQQTKLQTLSCSWTVTHLGMADLPFYCHDCLITGKISINYSKFAALW